jgi:hypothetical protein
LSNQHQRASATRSDKDNQDWLLNITIYAGALIILVFGGCTHFLNYLGWNLQHSESWELGALLWTALFVVYYFYTLELVGQSRIDKAIMVFLVLIVVLTFLAWMSLLEWRHQTLHVLSVTGIGIFLMLTDLLLSKYHKNNKLAFRQSFWIAGVPMVIAYVVLDVYMCSDTLLHKTLLHTNVESPEVFFSGAISFQLLASNVIFVIIQKGKLEGGGARRIRPKKRSS